MGKIPKDFYSDVDHKPFTECKVCGCNLSKGEMPYVVEKAFKRTEEGEDLTLFEMAICIQCAQEQVEKMSTESRAFLQRSLMGEELMKRRAILNENDWENTWRDQCILSNKTPRIHDEYHIVGQFLGDELLEDQSPYVIGAEIIEHIQENLSVETKEEWDNFGKQFYGPEDPQLKALLEDHQFVFV